MDGGECRLRVGGGSRALQMIERDVVNVGRGGEDGMNLCERENAMVKVSKVKGCEV